MKNLFPSLLIIIWCLSVQVVLAKETETPQNDVDLYYQKGLKAYEKKDYISAIKFLFAYKVTHKKTLSSKSDFLTNLDKSIEYSEKQLRTALKMKNRYSESWRANWKDINKTRRVQFLGTPASLRNTEAQELALVERKIELRRLEIEMLRLETKILQK